MNNNWTYYLDAVTEVNPAGTDKTSIGYKHDDGEIFFTQEFNGDLIFTGADYLIFKADYDLGNYCKRYDIYMVQKCTPLPIIQYVVHFSLIDGEMDLDRCTFKVKPISIEKYSCIKRNEDITVNLLDPSVNKYKITSDAYSYIEFGGSAQQEMDLVTTVNGEWVEVYNDLGYFTRPQAIYAREAIILPENMNPDDTWVEWSGDGAWYSKEVPEFHKKWVRGLDFITITVNSGDIFLHWNESYLNDPLYNFAANLSVIESHEWPRYDKYETQLFFKYSFLNTLNFINAEIEYVNCVKLTDAINFANNSCFINDLQSEFFTNATNPVTSLASKTNNIYLIQKSDAKRPGASGQATIGNTTWKDLMTAVQNYFNVKWYINDTSNLVIEHISTIQKNAGLDLTASPYVERLAGKRKFKWDKNKIFKFEQWNVQESKGIDFKGLPIIYADDCTVNDGKYTTKTYDVQDYITDIGFIQSQADKVSDQGFVIVACDVNDKIINETGILSGKTEINGHLALSSLHSNYWRHERIFLTGTMNGAAETFQSAIKLRQLDKLSIVKCCDVDFNPEETINTALGVANLEGAEYNFLDGKLTLDLYV